MYNEISEYVKSCDTCQQTASLPPNLHKKLQPIPLPDRPWVHVGIDLICDMPITSNGYKHILVIVCYLSKYVLARPLKSKTTKEVIENLTDIYLQVGLPDIIQHDQGGEFTSKAYKDFHKQLKMENRSTRAYHPMANGLVEAHNKILKMKLNKMGRQTGGQWDDLLQSAVLAMNSSRKKSINQTPFKLMWGRESRYQDLLSHVNNKNQFDEDSDDYTQLEEIDGHQVIDEQIR